MWIQSKVVNPMHREYLARNKSALRELLRLRKFFLDNELDLAENLEQMSVDFHVLQAFLEREWQESPQGEQ